MDLRELDRQLHEAIERWHDVPVHDIHMEVVAVRGVIDSLLAERDAENARLTEERDLAIVHDRQPYPTAWAYEQAVKALETQRERAEQAEAERDRLRARLTGVAIHAHRLANRIQPGTPAWAALADLRAALAQPSPHDALVNDLEAATARHANDHIAALAQPGDHARGEL